MRRGAERWDAIASLASLLGATLVDAPLPVPRNWPAVTKVAAQSLLAPALATTLDRAPDVPADVAAFLRAAQLLNRERNERAMRTLDRILATLNPLGIEPLLLKGIAALVTGLYDDPGTRVIGDVDILVREDRLDQTMAALIGSGLASLENDNDYGAHHHLRPLLDHEHGFAVEVHRAPVIPAHAAVLDADAMWQGATRLDLPDGKVWIPSPVARITHNIVHAQLQDGGIADGEISLRQHFELAALLRCFGDALDRTSVARHLARSPAPFEISFEIVETLFRIKVPIACDRRHDFITRARRNTERAPSLHFLAELARKARRRPAALLKLVRPAAWSVAASRYRELRARQSP